MLKKKKTLMRLSISLLIYFSFLYLSKNYSERFVVSDLPGFIVLFFFVIGFSVSVKFIIDKVFKIKI